MLYDNVIEEKQFKINKLLNEIVVIINKHIDKRMTSSFSIKEMDFTLETPCYDIHKHLEFAFEKVRYYVFKIYRET